MGFSPSLGSQALHKNVSCQGIMTYTDLFKALTRRQYRTKKQLILCVQNNLVLHYYVCRLAQIPKKRFYMRMADHLNASINNRL